METSSFDLSLNSFNGDLVGDTREGIENVR